jgi:serine protease
MKSSLLLGALATAVIGLAATTASAAPGGDKNWTNNPHHPAFNHPYRHGAVPTREGKSAMDRWNNEFYHNGKAFAANQPTASAGKLSYGGGVGGVGVMSGQNKVYLVFYGTQWGTQSGPDANGNYSFSGDASGAAGLAQKFFKGIGTNGELYQGDLTQWCEGIASGASDCSARPASSFVPYQQNILAGVWYDNSAASPASATGTQLAQEAVKAAAHFGNTATGSNRYTYYVILSPHGTNPDNYQSPTQGYCAWHDYTGDGYGVTAPGGDLAFSNQPYNIDVGSSCGVNFVNSGSAGTLDGYSMTLGHEWHEMMSDQFPAGGWTNKTGGSLNGQENSDECAWLAPGSAGGAANVAFATGTLAEQASWSNDTGACSLSHAIVSHGGGGDTTPPTASASESGTSGTITLSATASDNVGVTKVEFYVDSVLKGTDTTSPYSMTLDSTTLSNASHSLVAKAYDAAGNVGSSSAVNFTISNSGGGGGSVLSNGVGVTISDATVNHQQNWTMVVPAGATGLTFTMSGGTGDADMYVKFGSAPTLTSYDCRPYVSGNSESCPIATAQAGTYYVMVNAYAAYSGVTLKGSYSTGGGGGGCTPSGTVLCSGSTVTGLAASTGGWSTIYSIVVPAGSTKLTVTITGSSGDGDLYVRLGAAPTLSSYTCRPYLTGDNETCTITSPTAGTYYMGVQAYTTFSGVTLKPVIN